MKLLWFQALVVIFCTGHTLLADTFGLFTYTDNGTTITITGYPTTAVGAVTIPDTINGKPVTTIGLRHEYGASAFSGCAGVTSIHIPSSVTRIDYGYARLTVPAAIFDGCTELATITVDAANPTYSSENGVLFNKTKTSLITCPSRKSGNYTIPNGVVNVEFDAFWGCSDLTDIVISDSVVGIGRLGFSGCSGLTNITIPENVVGIGGGAFAGCGLVSMTIKGNPTIDVWWSIAYTLPPTLTSINVTGSFNFSANQTHFPNVTSVTILGDVPGIINGAYSVCESITSVIVSSGVTSIGNDAFSGCYRLTNLSLPNSLTSIGSQAFSGVAYLQSANLGNGLIQIGDGAFQNCFQLATTIPESVTTIGHRAFFGCYSLANNYNLNLPNLVSIGSEAFSGCHFRNLVFPVTLTNLGSGAFVNNPLLETAIFKGNAPPFAADVFDSASNDFKVYFNQAATDFSTPTWRGYAAFPGSPPSFTSQAPPPGRVRNYYEHILTAGNSPPPNSMKVTSGTLPPGLYLTMVGPSRWLIGGLSTTAGVYTGTITASNEFLPDATQEFSIDTNIYHTLTATGTNGTVIGGGTYLLDSTATATASANPGYIFTGWTGAATGNTNPLSVVMNANKTIGATFGPDLSDLDADGLSNYRESVELGTNPGIKDTDGDGVNDSLDGLPLDPTETLDSDNDGIGDNTETDDDNDGYADTDELNIHGTNPKRADSDSDGLTDPAEIQTHLTNPIIADTDLDGLSDGAELNTHSTLPKVADTDGDGFLDGYEVLTGKSPLDNTDKPAVVAEARTAVEFTFSSALGQVYRIEDSLDLVTWETVESGIAGNGAIIQRFYSTRGMPQRYFRVEKDGQ